MFTQMSDSPRLQHFFRGLSLFFGIGCILAASPQLARVQLRDQVAQSVTALASASDGGAVAGTSGGAWLFRLTEEATVQFRTALTPGSRDRVRAVAADGHGGWYAAVELAETRTGLLVHVGSKGLVDATLALSSSPAGMASDRDGQVHVAVGPDLQRYVVSAETGWKRTRSVAVQGRLTALTVDDQGSVYVAGTTDRGQLLFGRIAATDFEWGKMQVLDDTGTADAVRSLAIGPDGSLWAAGVTGSAGFLESARRERIPSIGPDAFVAKLSCLELRLEWLDILGGVGADEANAIGVAEDGRIWVAGATESTDFPAAGAGMRGARSDGFLVEFDADGNRINVLLRDGEEAARFEALALDGRGKPWVGGRLEKASRGEMFVGRLLEESSESTGAKDPGRDSKVAFAAGVGSTGTPRAASTSTTLTALPNPALIGQTVTLTASVSPAVSGMVRFMDGPNVIGTAPLSGGSAVLTTKLLSSGAHTLTANFLGDGGGYDPSVSPGVSLTVAGIALATYGTPTSLTIPGNAYKTFVRDLNGDQIPDIAIGHQGAGAGFRLTVYLGLGNGTFGPGTTSTTSAYAGMPLIGDFNGDGKPDFAFPEDSDVLSGTREIGVLLGNGNGTFQPYHIVGTMPYESYVIANDFDGDGRTDIGATGYWGDLLGNQSYGMKVLWGKADGTFDSSVIASALEDGALLASADVNGDGKPDLVSTTTSPAKMWIRLGQGSRSFGASMEHTSVGTPNAVQFGDFTGDGKIDLLVKYSSATQHGLLAGNGDGTFQAVLPLGASRPGVNDDLHVLDMNGDGKLDFMNTEEWGVLVMLGNGDGTFRRYSLAAGSDVIAPYSFDVGDFNGDGMRDVAVAYSVSQFRIFLGQQPVAVSLGISSGTSSWGQPLTLTATVTPGSGTGHITFLDGASILGSSPLTAGQSVLVTRSLPPGVHNLRAVYASQLVGAPEVASNVLSHTVTQSQASAMFAGGGLSPAWAPYRIKAGDLNRDGKADLVVSEKGEASFGVWLGSGDGTFGAGVKHGSGGFSSGITLGHVNLDGFPDVILDQSGFSNAITYLGDQNGALTQSFTLQVYTAAVVLADANRDGKPDYLLTDGAKLYVHLGYGTGRSRQFADYEQSLPFPSLDMTAGDINGDGNVDVVVVGGIVGGGNPHYAVLLGNGDGSFQAGITGLAGTSPIAPVLMDFDRDGRLDLVNANQYDTLITLLKGKGDGTFSPPSSVDVGAKIIRLISSDFDGDGKPDLAALSQAERRVYILSGDGAGAFTTTRLIFAGTGPEDLAAADLNGDGRVDLAITDSTENKVHVVLGALPTPSSVALIVTPATGVLGQEVTLTATVTPSGANGWVTFFEGESAIGSATVTAGQATMKTKLLNSGTRLLRAAFTSDGMNIGASSSALKAYKIAGSVGFAFGPPFKLAGAVGQTAVKADFNGDSIPDVASSPSDMGDVGISLGDGTGNFAAMPSIRLGSGLGQPVAADFNRDGKTDLYLGSTAGRFLAGRGNGTFDSVVYTSFPRRELIQGDFNADGYPDLAALQSTALEIYLNRGNGSLESAIRTTVTTNEVSAAVGDLNGDGKVDVILPDTARSQFYVLLGRGNGSFQAPVAYPTVSKPLYVVITDFNNDGIADVAVGDSVGTGRIGILLGSGDGSLENWGDVTGLSTAITWMGTCDCDGDGKADLVATTNTSAGNPVNLFRGKGDGTFNAPSTMGTIPLGVSLLSLEDLNLDGRIDFLVTGLLNDMITVGAMMSVSASSLTLAATPNPATLSEQVTLTATVTPSNAVGTIDFYDDATHLGKVAISSGQAVLKAKWLAAGPHYLKAVYSGDPIRHASSTSATVTLTVAGAPSGGFGAASTFATGREPKAIATGDLNRDGNLDLAIANTTSNTMSVLLGNGDGTFAPRVNYNTGSGPTAVAISDLNGDGKLDVVIGAMGGLSLNLYYGNGDGTLQAVVNQSVDATQRSLALGDMDGNGRPEIVIGTGGGYPLIVMKASNDGSFARIGLGSSYANAFPGIAIRNLDADGRPDIVAMTSNGYYETLRQTGTFSFVKVQQRPLPTPCSGIVLVDLNGDGKPDLATANSSAGSVSVLLGIGNVTFADPVDYPAGSAPAGITSADVDGDGKLDLVVVNSTQNTLTMLKGGGDGTFTSAGNFPTGTTPSAIVAGDFNGDGRTDLAVTNSADNTVNVYLGVAGIPAWAITKTHTGNFERSQIGAQYTITVRNSGSNATSGLVTVVDTMPAGLTATAMTGAGWSCTLATLTCTRSDALAPASAYPALTLTVNVAANAPNSVTNRAAVSGGGAAGSASVDDVTGISVYSISGQITKSGSPQAGVTVTLTGGPGGSQATDSSGNYSFTNLPGGGNYTLTPSLAGHAFTPASVTINGLAANQVANFTAQAVFSFSGSVWKSGVALPGVTMTLSGASSGTQTTNSSGQFSFVNLPAGGGYMVTPSLAGHTFVPSSASTTLFGNVDVPFTATAVQVTYTISGTVDKGGSPLQGVTVTLTGGPGGTRVTDSAGTYSFTGLPAGNNYTLTPSLAGYTFTPGQTTFTALASNQTANFIGKATPAAKIGVYNSSSGLWTLDKNGDGSFTPGPDGQFYLGWPGATRLQGDWNGDGRTKAGVYSGGIWYLDYDGNGVWEPGGADKQIGWGWPGATPVVGDWNGDGKTKIGVFSAGFWFLDYDGDFLWNPGAPDKQIGWGWTGATPVVGDWNGNGKTKIGVYSGGFWFLDYDGDYNWSPGNPDKQVGWGWAGAEIVTGDWNGDGRTKIGVTAGNFYFLDYDGDYAWDPTHLGGQDKQIGWGWPGATTVFGDWLGDGRARIGLYNAGQWLLDWNGDYTFSLPSDRVYYLGGAGEDPVVGPW